MLAGRSGMPPRSILVATALVAVLLALPYLFTRLAAATAGNVYLPAPYAPRDWLAYVALVHQPWSSGADALANPFTTEPQAGRLVLLPLQVLNTVHHATGLSGFALLELVRPPLLLLFVLALWSFVSRVFPAERDRRWAAMLVLLSGGWDFVAYLLADRLPEATAKVLRHDLWHLYGWSTFGGAYNPLWLAGLSLLLVVLARALRPDAVDAREAAIAGAALVVLWCTHPYSALAAGAILAGAWSIEWLLAGRPPWRGRGPLLVALAGAAVVVAALAVWQRADPVFRASSASIAGAHDAPVFWYPVAFGAVLLFAARGAARWIAERHAWRFSIAGALVAAVLLSSSDVVNGYHFIPYLHLPLCLLAAPAVADAFERAGGTWRGVAVRVALAVALFASTAANTVQSLQQARDAAVPASLAAAVERLGTLPPGNVLAPAWVGNVVPAIGPHRVYVGHYFMTPDYEARKATVDEILANPPGRSAELRHLVAAERIDYCVAPAAKAAALAAALGPAHGGGAVVGDWAILLVRRDGSSR
jgi:hypothetical protein